MKKLSLLLSFFIGLSIGVYAQNCYTGPNNITPRVSATPGLTPTAENLPCAVTGQQLSDTIYFTNYTMVGGAAVMDSLRIDSIGNLPAGTCWSTNKSTNTFLSGESGVIYIHGSNTAAPGQYKLGIFVTATIGAGIVIGPDANLATLSGQYYWIRVKCPGTACTTLDTVNGKTQAYIPYAACVTPPTATISPAGPDTICTGHSVTLTAGGGSGWTFKWSDAGHSATQSISVSASGSYTVTVYNGPDSAVSSPTLVVVGANPTAGISLSGPAAFCSGGTVNLTASTNTQYHWSNSSNSQSIQAAQSGTYTVTVTNSNGCTASASQVITVNPAPSVFINPANSNICLGQSDTLVASGADTYSWSTSATTAAIHVAPTGTATYSVTGTLSSDGCTASQSISIGVQTMPASQTIVGNTSIIPLQSYPYLVTATSGLTYTWSAQGGAIQSGQGTNSVNVIWGSNGPYSITLIQSNGCSDTITLSIVATGIANISENSLWSVYPNPAHDFVTIHNADLHNAAAYTVKVVNEIGQTVYTHEITKNDTRIETSAWGTSGIYFLYILSDKQDQVAVKKIILE